MRADVLTPVLPVRPGQPVEVNLEVLNTTDVIDEVTCHLPDHASWHVEQHPAQITLFPGERAAVTMTVHVPATFEAGEHDLLVRTWGEASGEAAVGSVMLDIEPVLRPRMRVSPARVTAGRKGSFEIEASNDGNAPLTLVLHATDSESRVRLVIEPAELVLGPGESGSARLTATHRRPLTGSIETRELQVSAEHLPHAISEDVVFRQKPIFPPGVITALTLACIIALWAFAIMFGVRAALSSEPPKKTVPLAFATGLDPATLDAAVLGADVMGSVTAATTGQPLPRITIELFNSKGERTGAGATKEDGSFALPAVLPGSYTVRYRAGGFVERWYPDAVDRSGATPIQVIAATPFKDLAASVIGEPGSVEGTVFAGDETGAPVDVTLTPVDLLPDVLATPIAPQRIAAGSTFRFTGLPTPATYRIRIVAAGFQAQEVQQIVPGGTAVVVNTVRLTAGAGSFGGVVTDPSGVPLGEVKVTTTLAGAPVATVTPTAGAIGQFVLAGLASPSSYVVTFSRPGFGTEVIAVRLAPGEERTGLAVVLSPSGGSVAGVIRSSNGTPLGDAEVKVVGAVLATTARTFTSGQIGGYRLSDLALPGTYTLAISKAGFRTETVSVALTKAEPNATADVVLVPSLGTVRGLVRDANGSPVGGAAVGLSDGAVVRSTTTASAPIDKVGTFEFVDVPPGSYTAAITSDACGCPAMVRLITVSAGAVTISDATIGGPQ